MPNLESLARRFFADPKWLVKWLIGGVLWFLPFVNILVLGYWLRMIRNIEKGRIAPGDLPEWDEWKELLLDGLKALLVYLIYIFIPILLASLIFGIFNTIFSFLKLQLLAWSLAFLPFVPILALAPSVLVAALSQHARSGSFDDLLRVDKPVKIALKALPQLLLPTLALYGLLILGYPIFPFAAFFAFTLYAAYCTALFKSQRKTSSKSI